MRSREGRPQEQTGQTQITFQDVRACFSTDESKLLHDWQKELFKKVMKEIHQALLSLGPVIAASVFSLSAEEIEDLCSNNNNESESRGRANRSPVQDDTSATLSASVKEEEDSDLTDHEDPTETQNINYPKDGINTCPNTGAGGALALLSVSIKEEVEAYPVSLQDHTEAQNTPCASGLPPLPSELEAWRMDYMDAKVDEGDPSSSSGISVVTASFSIFTDEVTGPHNMDHEGSEERESNDCPSDIPVVTAAFSLFTDEAFELQHMDHEDSSDQESRYCPSGDGSLPQTSPEGTDHMCDLSLDSYHESAAEEDAQFEINLDNPEHFSVHQVHCSVNATATYDSESHPMLFNSLANSEQGETVYTCTECEECFFVETDFVEHMKKHTRVRAFPCTICEKSFFTKTQLLGHYKIHTGKKPYICMICQKGFKRKDHLNGHVRIHTGERPYTCTECDRSFRCKTNLNSHKRNCH